MRTRTAFLVRGLSAAAVAALLAGCTPDAVIAPEPGESALLIPTSASASIGESGLAEIRAATARYHRVEVAIADGYKSTIECAARPGVGAMGIHYVNAALRTDAAFDPTHPEVLVYEPQKNGQLRLVAVEYFIWRANWDAAHPGTTPSLLGHDFFRSFGPAAHGLPDHYELHAWLWRHNPYGMFAQWNPNVTCP
ncbi:MAG: hypothetical protein LH467_13100 [Gemmatimonadaceae bacterium]|nr:hypothetical protein [Gemmatimonadaceae bacterium]